MDAIAAFNARDREGIRAVLAPEVEIRRPFVDVSAGSAPSFPGTYHGVEEVLSWVAQAQRSMPDFQADVRNSEIGEDGRVLIEVLISLGPEQPQQLTWGVLTVEDGRIARSQSFTTEDAARAALGRRP